MRVLQDFRLCRLQRPRLPTRARSLPPDTRMKHRVPDANAGT